MTVFISGPVTSDPDYHAKFAAAEQTLTAAGHHVLNPAILPGWMTHEQAMHICYAMIDVAEAVFFLPGWRESKGSCWEYRHALAQGKLVEGVGV